MRSVTFAPDGKLFASRPYDSMVRLWDVQTRSAIGGLLHNDIIISMVFSPDGKKLALGSYDNALMYLRDVESREKISTTKASNIEKLAISLDTCLGLPPRF